MGIISPLYQEAFQSPLTVGLSSFHVRCKWIHITLHIVNSRQSLLGYLLAWRYSLKIRTISKKYYKSGEKLCVHPWSK